MRSIRKLQRIAKDSVEEHLLNGEKHPDKLKKNKKLNNVRIVRKLTSKTNQANVEVLKEQW